MCVQWCDQPELVEQACSQHERDCLFDPSRVISSQKAPRISNVRSIEIFVAEVVESFAILQNVTCCFVRLITDAPWLLRAVDLVKVGLAGRLFQFSSGHPEHFYFVLSKGTAYRPFSTLKPL